MRSYREEMREKAKVGKKKKKIFCTRYKNQNITFIQEILRHVK